MHSFTHSLTHHSQTMSTSVVTEVFVDLAEGVHLSATLTVSAIRPIDCVLRVFTL